MHYSDLTKEHFLKQKVRNRSIVLEEVDHIEKIDFYHKLEALDIITHRRWCPPIGDEYKINHNVVVCLEGKLVQVIPQGYLMIISKSGSILKIYKKSYDEL